MLVVAMLAAGYCLFLPRTLFDEPFSATVWSRDGRLMSAKVASDGQWRFFPTDSVPEKFRVAAISGWIRWRWGVPCGRTLRPGGSRAGRVRSPCRPSA
mgnify:CR=1 FL=1